MHCLIQFLTVLPTLSKKSANDSTKLLETKVTLLGRYFILYCLSNYEYTKRAVTSQSREGVIIPKVHLSEGTGGSRRSHWRGPVASSAKNMEQISKLGGSGGMPPGKIFFLMIPNAANWAILTFL